MPMRSELRMRTTRLHGGQPRQRSRLSSVHDNRDGDWAAVFVFCATALIAALGVAAVAYVAYRFPAFGAVLVSLDPY